MSGPGCTTATRRASSVGSPGATSSVEADAFSIYLDPHHDHLTGVQFGVSAAGVQRDALIYNDQFLGRHAGTRSGRPPSRCDDGGLDGGDAHPAVAAALHARGRATRGESTSSASSSARRRVVIGSSSCARTRAGLASRMAHLEGLVGIPPPGTLELMPYVTSRAEFIAPAVAGNPFNDGARAFGGGWPGPQVRRDQQPHARRDVQSRLRAGRGRPRRREPHAVRDVLRGAAAVLHGGRQGLRQLRESGASEYWGFFFLSRVVLQPPDRACAAGAVPSAVCRTRPRPRPSSARPSWWGKTRRGWTLGALNAVTGPEEARLFDGVAGATTCKRSR